MNDKIIVYTSVVGIREQLREDQAAAGATFLAFVDRPWGSAIWKERPAYAQFRSDRRNARTVKILAHHYVDASFSLWLDGRVSLRVPASRLVDEWLGGYDLAVFSHPKRQCTYDEAAVCAARALDQPEVIRQQAEYYSSQGFPAKQGLAETTILLRRHSKQMEMFNAYWWAEISRYSIRDQISFMYSVAHIGLKVNFIPGNVRRHPYFDVLRRPARREVLGEQA